MVNKFIICKQIESICYERVLKSAFARNNIFKNVCCCKKYLELYIFFSVVENIIKHTLKTYHWET